MEENNISGKIIGAAIEVHRVLGPGLLESVYQQCLVHELVWQGLKVQVECPFQAQYKGKNIDVAYRLDMLVNEIVVVELTVVERVLAIHEAQLLSYLCLTGKRLGLLLNFNVPVMTSGIKRMVNDL